MGVDIAFYIEVRNQENWVRLHFRPPFATKEEPNQSYWDTDCFFCRYYHFTDFLDEATSHIRGGPKERICRETAGHLEDDDSYGTFMFEDLVKYCEEAEKKMFASLANAGLYPVKQQLDRIEAKLSMMQPANGPDKDEEDYTDEMYRTAEEIYEDYTSEYYCVRHLRDIVSGIVAACHPYVYESDIRIFYLIC